MSKTIVNRFEAEGNPSIRATNRRTIEITTEDFLTLRGDCIIGIKSQKSCRDLAKSFKEAMQSNSTKIIIKLTSGGESDTVVAWGNENLTFESEKSMVIRRSEYICPRTLAIKANKASKDLSPLLKGKLRNSEKLKVELSALKYAENLKR